MKLFNVIRSYTFLAVLMAMGLLSALSGCAGSPGMTSRQVHRNHINAVSSNWLMLQKDIDEFLMLDNPSRLSDSISR